ncbi:alginate O-acetyltransferase AlgX-related protein [Neolewinella persica]|uniref:alginate O-acetyltransferase AlgX-related protein n=1 Tax=Neolewinella persica TaxID=70998 RepID=UPI0003749B78|nr:hypothetical protein [Neolewinella persica]
MRILLGVLLLLLLLPLLFFNRVGTPLANHKPAGDPEWSLSRWFSGAFQEDAARRLNEQFGGRNTLVRLNNQKEYSLFNIATARDVVIGKEGYLYEDTYLNTATGRNYQGSRHFEDMGTKLALVRDSLAKYGVDLLVVMAAGKGTYFPEYYPAAWDGPPPARTNEDELLRILENHQVPYLNFNAWFKEMKDTVQYPLFPKAGIHWTKYGQYLVMDSLLNYLEERHQIDLPDLVLDSIEVSVEQRGSEADIFRGLNILQQPAGFPLAYPTWHVEHPEKEQLKTLVIGDSFYWSLYLHQQFSKKFLGNGEFWYYFNRVMWNGRDDGSISDVHLPEDLLGYKQIILFETESHYHRLSNGFLEAAVAAFITGSSQEKSISVAEEDIQETMEQIRNTPKWLEQVSQKAIRTNRTLEAALHNEARFYLEERIRKKRLRRAQNRK